MYINEFSTEIYELQITIRQRYCRISAALIVLAPIAIRNFLAILLCSELNITSAIIITCCTNCSQTAVRLTLFVALYRQKPLPSDYKHLPLSSK